MMKCKRIITILLVALLLFGTVGCGNKNSGNGNGANIFPQSAYNEQGLHQDNSKVSDKAMLVDGKTEYKILVPKQMTNNENFAVYELIEIFRQSTGVSLQTVVDNGTPNYSNKYISVGETSYKSKSGLEMTAELKSGGYRIITKDNTIIVAGYEDKGTINGVYHLMEKLVNYDYLYKDTTVVDKNVRNLPLYDFDITEAPDIEYADINYKWIQGAGLQVVNRYRITKSAEIYVGDLAYHNEFSIFGLNDDTFKDHPLWLNDPNKPQRVCYTAHGDKEEQKKMLDTAFERFKEQLILDTEDVIACLNMQDSGNECKCDACSASLNKYGSNAAAYVQFANKLKLRIDEWFASEEGKPYARDLELSISAYLDYSQAPVKIDSEGNYYAVDDSVKCVDGVVPKITLLGANYTVPLNNVEKNSSYSYILGWATLSDELTFYLYNTNFHYMLAPYHTFNSIQENFRMAFHYKTRYVQNLSQHVQANYSTGWNNLSAYVQSKLAWNVNINVQDYIEKFFKYYFEDGADAMYEQYMSWRGWSIHLENDFGKNGYDTIFDNVIREDFFPKSLLEQWFDCYDRALEEIEYLKETNREKYDRLYDHITGEKVSTLYLYIEIYGDKIPPDTCLALKKECKQIAEHLGMSSWKEGGKISEIWTKWQV